MAGSTRVTIDGDKELIAKLKRLAGASGRVLGAGIEKGAAVIRDEAKRKAPVKSGRLRRSIVVEKRSDTEVLVGPTKEAFYGVFLEFGTKHIPAQPWLKPAYEAKKAEAKSVISKDVASEIERLF